jgi:hypothetical protein
MDKFLIFDLRFLIGRLTAESRRQATESGCGNGGIRPDKRRGGRNPAGNGGYRRIKTHNDA